MYKGVYPQAVLCYIGVGEETYPRDGYKEKGDMIGELSKETLARLYIKEKTPLRDIAKMAGRSYTFVRHKCMEYGIPLRPKNYKIIVLEKPVLLRLYVQEGKSPRDIAQIYSCTPATVRKRFRQYGIPLTDNTIKGLDEAEVQKLYVEEGKSLKEIANIIGCSHETVRKRCKKHGVKLKPIGSKVMGIDKSTLQRLYMKERRPLSNIADMFSCSTATIRNRCRDYGIKLKRGRPKTIKE